MRATVPSSLSSSTQSSASQAADSKCAPTDAKRYGVEFEKLPGVFWISDKLDCEGIEDIDYWDRPLPGSITLVVIGMPGK